MDPSSSETPAAPRGAAMAELSRGRRFALIVGIDAYENGVTPLSGAAAAPDEASAETPGYFLPQDAALGREDTFLSMKAVRELLEGLKVHHLLLVLDCCFAGAFRWAGTRAVGRPNTGRRSLERFQRYLREPSWTVITSAAQDERALDAIDGKVMLAGSRGLGSSEATPAAVASSPFAIALGEGLSGEADAGLVGTTPDGVITAVELHFYITQRFDRWEREMNGRRLQKPMIFPWPDKANDKGEFVFVNPKVPTVELESAGPLLERDNPYRGLRAYEYVKGGEARRSYFGRDALSKDLFAKVTAEGAAHVLLLGSSGSGKTSLVGAGLLPLLEGAGWDVRKPWRPGERVTQMLSEVAAWLDPASADTDVAAAARRAFERDPTRRCVVVIDQLEELVTTMRRGFDAAREALVKGFRDAVEASKGRLRAVYVLRSDYEPQFAHALKPLGVTVTRVTPMSREELREAIEGPAESCVLQFRPPELVERIVGEVADAPGALPLLSFTLSELYIAYVRAVREGRAERAIEAEDYDKVGGVEGSLGRRAEEVFAAFGDAQSEAREVLLRAVSPEAGGTRRRLYQHEIRYEDPAKGARVERVIDGLVKAQLMVVDQDANGEARYEFAHNRIVLKWPRLQQWISDPDEKERLEARERLREKVDDWVRQGRKEAWLDSDPRLSHWNSALAGRLNADEATLLRGSLWRKRRNLIALVSVVAGAFAILLGVTFYAVVQKARAEHTAAALRVQERATAKSEREARQEAMRSRAAELRARMELPGRELDELADALNLVRTLRDAPPGVGETLLVATLAAGRTRPLSTEGCRAPTARFSREDSTLGAVTADGDETGCAWEASARGRPARGATARWCDAPSGGGYTLQRTLGGGSAAFHTGFDGVIGFVAPADRPPFAARGGAPCAMREAREVSLGDAGGAFVDGARVRRVEVRDGEARLFEEDPARSHAPRPWRIPVERGAEVALAGLSPDGRYVFTSDGRQSVSVWAVEGRRRAAGFRGWAPGVITAVSFSQGLRWLFVASDVAGRTVGEVYRLALDTVEARDTERPPVGKVMLDRSIVAAWFLDEGDNPNVAVSLADGSASVVMPVYASWAFGMTVAAEALPGAALLDVAMVRETPRFLFESRGALVLRGTSEEALVTRLGVVGQASSLRRYDGVDDRFAEAGRAPSLVVRTVDGRSALTLCDDHLSLWRVDDARVEREATIPRASLDGLAGSFRPREIDFARLAPDRVVLAAVDPRERHALRLWELDPQRARVTSSREIALPSAHDPHALALSPRGDLVAVASSGERVSRILRVRDGVVHRALSHEDEPGDVGFSADGARVITAAGASMFLWSVGGERLASIPSGFGAVYDADFAGEGARERLVTLTADRRARAWSIAPEAVRRAACDRLRGEPIWTDRADVRAACGAPAR